MNEEEHPLSRAKRLAAANRPSARGRRAPPRGPSAGERALARQIRSTYIAARSAWESVHRGVDWNYRPTRKVDRGDRDKKSVWLRLADLFAYSGPAAGLDPVDFIHDAFERTANDRPPSPEQLLFSRSIEDYRASVRRRL